MFTEDALFGGRLLLSQAKKGYRFSADAPLLIWFATTSAPKRVRCALDLGAGCGVVGLGLLAADRAEHVVAVEAQERLQEICARNAEKNGFAHRLEIARGDMRDRAVLAGRLFDLIAVNPPFWRADDGQLPDDEERRIACHEILVALDEWVAVAARVLEPRRGRLYAIYPARRVTELLSSFAGHGLGPTAIKAVHSRPDEDAELVLVEARRGSKRPVSISPPLVLRDRDNAETALARGIFSGEFSPTLSARKDGRSRS
jgi:tRNA1Val (adenine37-N6)-methyltransferase